MDEVNEPDRLRDQVSRPGQGGRQPRIPSGSESSATAELHERYGEPFVETHKGSRVEIWEIDPQGNAAIGARLSSGDLSKGEKALAQIDGALELCDKHGLLPRYVVVGVRLSGEKKLEDRLDLQFVMTAVEQKRVDTVVFREVDRLARNPAVGENFFSFMRDHGASLFLEAETPNNVDWDEGMLLLRVKSGVAAHERSVIARRTFSAIERRMLLAGKGWPGSIKFGFRRDAEKYLEVDPEQWPLVERICFDYSRVGENGRGSLTALVEHLKDQGCSFSREKIRQILRDPIYVTGEWSSTVNDIEYPCRKIEIPRPIPVEVFARNQALLSNTKGRNGNATPYGHFLLNHIPFLHATCMDLKVPKTRQNGIVDQRTPMLRGSNLSVASPSRKRPPVYSHRPSPPKGTGCKGFAVEAKAVDEGVIQVLLELAESPELQLAYINAMSRDRQVEEVVDDPDELRRRLSGLKKKHDALVRNYIDNPQNDDVSETRGIAALLAGIENDMEAVGNRLALVEADLKAEGRNPKPNLREELERVLVLGDDPSREDRQRRAALVSSLLSKVVLHNGDQGVELELFGHLIPNGKTVVPADIQIHMREKLEGSMDPSTKRALSGRIHPEIDQLLPQGAAWKSRRLRILDLVFERNGDTLDSIKRCIRFADRNVDAGTFFAKEGREVPRYEQVRREFPSLLAIPTIRAYAAKRGLGSDAVVRSALGDEGALRNQRVKPESSEDIKLLIRWAFEDGMTWGPGLKMRWEEVEPALSYLRSWASSSKCAKKFGSTLAILIEQVAEELGLSHAATKVEGARIKRGLGN